MDKNKAIEIITIIKLNTPIVLPWDEDEARRILNYRDYIVADLLPVFKSCGLTDEEINEIVRVYNE